MGAEEGCIQRSLRRVDSEKVAASWHRHIETMNPTQGDEGGSPGHTGLCDMGGSESEVALEMVTATAGFVGAIDRPLGLLVAEVRVGRERREAIRESQQSRVLTLLLPSPSLPLSLPHPRRSQCAETLVASSYPSALLAHARLHLSESSRRSPGAARQH